jgi:Cu+-exporting ATPase
VNEDRQTSTPKITDPVCGMTVDPDSAKHRAEHEGETYLFCSAHCLEKFEAAPARYVGTSDAHGHAGPEAGRGTGTLQEPAQPGTRTKYTCPMHPEIVRNEPGPCPICGMALEPMTVSLDDEASPELIDMTRRFWVGVALAVPVFVLAMGEMIPGVGDLIPAAQRIWIELILATPVVLWAGWPFFERGWRSLLTRHLNMFTLIALGVGAAYGYSVVATLAPGLFPATFRGPDGTVAVYFEAGAVITVLVLLGQVLELRARERTSGALRSLLDLAPTKRFPLTRCGRATACGYGRAKRCRSTARFLTAAAPSTNPW